MLDLNRKRILITGGTGSFGKKFIDFLLEHFPEIKIIVFSRDEYKQHQISSGFSKDKSNKIDFILGDVRDAVRLKECMNGVDYVIHAAALKHVLAGEQNPSEFIKTNITGAENVISAAQQAGVKKVVAMSTDKAVAPLSLYGATKLCSDKLFTNAANSSGTTLFSVVRYGNLLGSRGSVLPLFIAKAKEGLIPITDEGMTRFHISYKEVIALVMFALEKSLGGEIIVPKLPSFKITDLAKVVAPECKTEIIGKRPGEKLHEELLTEAEVDTTFETSHYYIVSGNKKIEESDYLKHYNAAKVKKGFRYSSDSNNLWLDTVELKKLVDYEIGTTFLINA